jgi:hypothetical protein
MVRLMFACFDFADCANLLSETNYSWGRNG